MVRFLVHFDPITNRNIDPSTELSTNRNQYSSGIFFVLKVKGNLTCLLPSTSYPHKNNPIFNRSWLIIMKLLLSLDTRDTLRCDVMVSGADAEYFFSDVLDAAHGYNSPFKTEDIAATTAVPPPSGKVSDRFLSIWTQQQNDYVDQGNTSSSSSSSSSNSSSSSSSSSSKHDTNKRKDLLEVLRQRLEQCVQSQEPMDMYLESYDSFEAVVEKQSSVSVIKNNKKRAAKDKGNNRNNNNNKNQRYLNFL